MNDCCYSWSKQFHDEYLQKWLAGMLCIAVHASARYGIETLGPNPIARDRRHATDNW